MQGVTGPRVRFRFHDELNDFLDLQRRNTEFDHVAGDNTPTEPEPWVFPSPKNDGPTYHTSEITGICDPRSQEENRRLRAGCGVECRPYDMRHTFATRFALGGGSLALLAKILGRADLSLSMCYVHPSQADMDRDMEWYNGTQIAASTLEQMPVSSS